MGAITRPFAYSVTIMDTFIQAMNSPRGRILRILLGAVMITLGWYSGGVLGWSIALAGLVPMVPAFFGRCA